MSKRSFAQALRQARLKAGLSQTELGQRTGLTGSYISQLEAGHRRPLIGRRIEALCQALGIPPGPLQEAAELERSTPTVRKKIESVTRDRMKLQRTRDRLLLLSAIVAQRQSGAAALESLPNVTEEQRRLAARLFSRLHGVDGVTAAEREIDRVFDGLKPGQRDTLLRIVTQVVERAVDAPTAASRGASVSETHTVAERVTLAPSARIVRHHAAPDNTPEDAFFWRMPDDEAHPRIEAGDRLLLVPVPSPLEGAFPEGDIVVAEVDGRAHVRRAYTQGHRLRLESLRPDVPPLRVALTGTALWLIRQVVRDL